MVDIVRRKDATIVAKDYSYRNTEAQAYGNWADVAGGVSNAFKANQKKQEEKEKKQAEDYRNMVSSNLKAAQKQMADQKKAFDASDKLIAADRAGQLKNDLLRWNLTQRENNSAYIGSREHESAMRAEYDRLANKYNVGLGEVGMADFQEKTQGYVNTFLDNDIKWAYQQKLKQGEESAKASAQQIEQTAALHGANGDTQGFNDSYEEMSAPLEEYIKKASPENAPFAMAELAKRSVTADIMGLADADPVIAKEALDDLEKFKEHVPQKALQHTVEAMLAQEERALLNQLADVDAKLENTKKGSPAYRELEKKKKDLEKELKNYNAINEMRAKGDWQVSPDSEYGKRALKELYKSVGDSVKTVVDKAAGEKVLADKQQAIAERVDKFGNFLMMPTPENLKWFEEDNQISYVQEEKNMSELPEEFKTKARRNTELIKNMMKYRENFGNVSMVEISDYKGTKQMFDDLKATAQTDADKDGNIDNVLLKAIVGCNNAHSSEISQKDFDRYVDVMNHIVYDRTFKKQITDFIDNTKHFMPDKFWTAPRLLGSKATQIETEMEGRTRDVMLSVLYEWQKGEMSSDEITNMYIKGLEKAYDDTVSDFLGINMNQVKQQYKENGVAIANIGGIDYFYKGLDASGNPKWEEVGFGTGMAAAKKIKENKTGWSSL